MVFFSVFFLWGGEILREKIINREEFRGKKVRNIGKKRK